MSRIEKVNLNWRGRLTPLNPSNVVGTVIHHLAHPSWGLRDTHNFHRNTNGWTGIGYNYLINRNGTIYEGRGDNVGAHAAGNNSNHLGVALTGDFERGTQVPTKAQMDSLVWLIGELKKKYSNADKVKGHNEVGSTSCPGRRFPMNDLKRRLSGSSSSGQTFAQRHPTWWNQRNNTILSVQQHLNRAGYDVGAEDRHFGQRTLDAVRKFQLDYDLSSESGNFFGVPGPETRSKLAEIGPEKVRVKADSLNYRSRASFDSNAVAGQVSRGEVFTVRRRVQVTGSNTDLFELISGTFVTAHPNFVEPA